VNLVTKRLLLRLPTKKDAEDITKNINNLKVTKWLLVVPYPYKIKDAFWWINKTLKEFRQKEKKGYHFSIELKKEKKVIGGIGLEKINKFIGTAEVGYWLGEKYWMQGYGKEALREVLKFAFNKLKLKRIEAEVFSENPSSGKLLELFGFKKEGYKRRAVRCKADGKVKDVIIYGLLKEDWKK